MTCFWDGQLQGIPPEMKSNLGGNTPKHLIEYYVQHNRVVTDVTWNGTIPTPQQCTENMQWVASVRTPSPTGTYVGAWCPHLFLFCSLFHCDIDHTYAGVQLQYRVPGATHLVVFANNRGHFTFRNRMNKQ